MNRYLNAIYELNGSQWGGILSGLFNIPTTHFPGLRRRPSIAIELRPACNTGTQHTHRWTVWTRGPKLGTVAPVSSHLAFLGDAPPTPPTAAALIRLCQTRTVGGWPTQMQKVCTTFPLFQPHRVPLWINEFTTFVITPTELQDVWMNCKFLKDQELNDLLFTYRCHNLQFFKKFN
jgi:hypothetical protein